MYICVGCSYPRPSAWLPRSYIPLFCSVRPFLCSLLRYSRHIRNLIRVSYGNITTNEYTKMDSAQRKSATFDGTGDVCSFIAKVELYSSLKSYTGEKCAQALASKLQGPAFDVYLCLSSDDRKDASKITAELLKEFECGKRNREEALSELSKRKREIGESTQNFAYKILELVKLAYPKFESKI